MHTCTHTNIIKYKAILAHGSTHTYTRTQMHMYKHFSKIIRIVKITETTKCIIMPQREFRNLMGWVNYPQQHQTYLDACFEASLRRGLPGAIIFSDSVINHRHYFNLQCTYYSCHCVIAMAIKLWANLKPEEETIISFFVNEKKFALIEEQLWINNIFSKIFD